MNEINSWESFKSQTKSIKIIIASLYLQYVFAVVLAILMISTGSIGLLCLLLPYILAHWVAEGVLMQSRFWHIFGGIYILFTTLVTAFFMLGLTFDVKASGQTYLISAPKTQITLLLAVILVLYGLWAGVFLFLQTPNKKKI